MITFRAIEREDLDTIKCYRNEDSVRNFTREYRLLNRDDQEKWFDNYLNSRRRSDFDQEILIIQTDSTISDKLCTIGVGGFTRIEWKNRKAEFTFYLNLSGKSQGIDLVKESITLLLRKGFFEFGFNKIYWPIYSHDPSLEIYKSIFHEEAILREEYFWNGKMNDRVYLSITFKEFLSKFANEYSI